MDEQTYGLKETKEVLSIIFSMIKAVDASIADDGKITLADAGKFMSTVMSIPEAIKGIGDVSKELKDLSEEEGKELVEWAKVEFDISDDKVEAYIEEGLSIAFSILKLIKQFGAK